MFISSLKMERIWFFCMLIQQYQNGFSYWGKMPNRQYLCVYFLNPACWCMLELLDSCLGQNNLGLIDTGSAQHDPGILYIFNIYSLPLHNLPCLEWLMMCTVSPPFVLNSLLQIGHWSWISEKKTRHQWMQVLECWIRGKNQSSNSVEH